NEKGRRSISAAGSLPQRGALIGKIRDIRSGIERLQLLSDSCILSERDVAGAVGDRSRRHERRAERCGSKAAIAKDKRSAPGREKRLRSSAAGKRDRGAGGIGQHRAEQVLAHYRQRLVPIAENIAEHVGVERLGRLRARFRSAGERIDLVTRY